MHYRETSDVQKLGFDQSMDGVSGAGYFNN
jgi:hypothetical protein